MVELVVDLSDVNEHLEAVHSRGIYTRGITIADFQDETLFYKDDAIGTLYAFSKRPEFWEMSWGDQIDRETPRAALLGPSLVSAFTLSKAYADLNWSLPFNMIYNSYCPTGMEFDDAGSALVADLLVTSVNTVFGAGTAVRLSPAQSLPQNLGNGRVRDFGLILAHTSTIRVDTREEGPRV